MRWQIALERDAKWKEYTQFLYTKSIFPQTNWNAKLVRFEIRLSYNPTTNFSVGISVIHLIHKTADDQLSLLWTAYRLDRKRSYLAFWYLKFVNLEFTSNFNLESKFTWKLIYFFNYDNCLANIKKSAASIQSTEHCIGNFNTYYNLIVNVLVCVVISWKTLPQIPF